MSLGVSHIRLQRFCGLGLEKLVFEILLTLISHRHSQAHTDTHRLLALQNVCVLPVAHLLQL